MGLFEKLKRDRDERYNLSQLRYSRERAEEGFKAAVAGLKPRDEQYQEHRANMFAEIDYTDASIAEIETKMIIRRSLRWKVPIPARPMKEGEPHDFWTWHEIHGRYYISDKGQSQLRREIHQEWEMWWKPWLSWVAIGISVISLGFSIIRS